MFDWVLNTSLKISAEIYPKKFVLILLIKEYSVRMRENTDQNNSEYRHFLRSVTIYVFDKSQIFEQH